MLIGSENTCICVLVILYEVLIRGNHAGGGKVLLKKSCHEIMLPAAKARFAQVLRYSPRAMPLLSYPSTRGCPARHLMMTCQSFGRTMKCKSTGIYVAPFYVDPMSERQRQPHSADEKKEEDPVLFTKDRTPI